MLQKDIEKLTDHNLLNKYRQSVIDTVDNNDLEKGMESSYLEDEILRRLEINKENL